MSKHKTDCKHYFIVLGVAHCAIAWCAGKIFCDDSCYEEKPK